MKLTIRCGSAAVDGLNEALLAKAAAANLLRISRVRADTTVVPSNVAYPTDSGLLAQAVRLRHRLFDTRAARCRGRFRRQCWSPCSLGGTMRKRLVGAASIATAALVGFATPAGAFECYNAVRSAQGNLSAARANALYSFEEILSDPEIVGLCAEGVEFVLAGLEDAGYRTDVLINFRTLMARGLELRHEEQLHDGSGIDHLSEEFFATADPLVGQAFEICLG
jgi:hypothetical protein